MCVLISEVSWLVRCPDFRGWIVHKHGVAKGVLFNEVSSEMPGKATQHNRMTKQHNTACLKESFQRKISCLGWDLNPRHSHSRHQLSYRGSSAVGTCVWLTPAPSSSGLRASEAVNAFSTFHLLNQTALAFPGNQSYCAELRYLSGHLSEQLWWRHRVAIVLLYYWWPFEPPALYVYSNSAYE